jgi:hypothetical protein
LLRQRGGAGIAVVSRMVGAGECNPGSAFVGSLTLLLWALTVGALAERAAVTGCRHAGNAECIGRSGFVHQPKTDEGL